MTTIAYDQHIEDFIAGLDATKHVTHTAYRKSSVTFHHNGGRLSLQGILDVWKTREASAHFQSDGEGRLGQYVRVNEYAWATGNTQGNKESISIEMADATLAPDYVIAEATWKSAARLAGWLFARVIGERPSRANVFVHHHWKSTTCAGPYIDKIFDRLLGDVIASYEYFSGQVGAAPTPSAPPAAPSGGGKSLEQIVAEVKAGQWGNGPDRRARLEAAGYNYAAVQAVINGGSAPAAPAGKSMDQLVSEVLAGEWGNNPERSQKLAAAGYSPTAVQAAVNARLGGGGGSPVVRLSISALADQVLRNQWGNGPERRRRLTAAGYDYNAVQAEVNRRLR
jgi:hypothetical protein